MVNVMDMEGIYTLMGDILLAIGITIRKMDLERLLAKWVMCKKDTGRMAVF